ncbi:MAG TPA: hypothetical protein VIH93_03380 [Thermoanaerobaculia bacterium]|jgi:hypothetical protein
MRQRALILLPAAVLAAALAGCAWHVVEPGFGARRTVRTLNGEVADAGTAPVDVDTAAGQLAVEAWDEPRVGVTARIQCRGWSCRAARSIQLRVAEEDGRIKVRLDGWPHVSSHGLQAMVTVRMPRGAAVDAQLGAGRIDITGIEGDVEAHLGVGRLQLAMPEAAAARISMDTGLGEAALISSSGRRERHSPLGASLRWEGRGRARVALHCGVGIARARLG